MNRKINKTQCRNVEKIELWINIYFFGWLKLIKYWEKDFKRVKSDGCDHDDDVT